MWLIAAHWTKRQMRRSANVEGRAEAAVLEPLHQENRELRALVERQEIGSAPLRRSRHGPVGKDRSRY